MFPCRGEEALIDSFFEGECGGNPVTWTKEDISRICVTAYVFALPLTLAKIKGRAMVKSGIPTDRLGLRRGMIASVHKEEI